MIVTDQERDSGNFESAGMASFRENCLPARRRLFSESIRFNQHRVSTSACVPSRVSLLTGYSPWVHGVKQTDGFAKFHDDPQLNWLPSDRIPTLGHRFQAHDWDSVYFGKWHLSYANLHHEQGAVVSATEPTVYQAADPLAAYGFNEWVGPEPHGADIKNSGLFRDEGYVTQAQEWLRSRAKVQNDAPFLLVISLVNPHDIVFWPPWSLWQSKFLELDGIPHIGEAASQAWIPKEEAAVLRAYRKQYASAYGPASIVNWLYDRNPERYRKFYCSLLRRSDRLLGQILNCLDETQLRASTHVVMTSDHGELLGAHGGLHQKWYNAYEETIRVPLAISSPRHSQRAGEIVERCSDHLDLVPTLLSLAGLPESLPGSLCESFESVPALSGVDLLNSPAPKPSYFVTHDHILEGNHREAAFGRRFPWFGAIWPMKYKPLEALNTAVESVTEHVSDSSGATRLWKLVRYFSPEEDWAHDSDEWSLFNLDEDPSEMDNLFSDTSFGHVRDQLLTSLESCREGSLASRKESK
ncbi:MAG: sulfatase-like hydrolase/transferase [Deltaproteobacteria bacterium]|nr:sulfatase-like hydrolase/transferase [Deltaproteobacteria bacterium]MBT6434518.1 sulfatase-like hydrolase/transferase [Deltaproteobacteria bacterium]MBT6492309.1 sulfatase-like hydrolase/transferase [Deltaproteobacteria bacterium]